MIYLCVLAIGVAGMVASRRHRTPTAILIFAVAALLPLVANRHYPLFCLALVVLAGEHIADIANPWAAPIVGRLGQSRFVAAACMLVSLLLLWLSWPRLGCIRIDPFYCPFPARAVTLLRDSGARGNMAVPFDWGEYILWHLGPAVRVSIDGRRETLYSHATYEQSLDFERGQGVWNALLGNSGTDLVLVHNTSPTANLMSLTSGWVPVYQDKFCVLFARAGTPSLERIVRTPVPQLPDEGAGLCFPAPGRAGER
jgi:hypothetical protein